MSEKKNNIASTLIPQSNYRKSTAKELASLDTNISPIGKKHPEKKGLIEKINELIYKQASEAKISDYVFKNNKKIFINGLEAVIAGETSITEILRVSQE